MSLTNSNADGRVVLHTQGSILTHTTQIKGCKEIKVLMFVTFLWSRYFIRQQCQVPSVEPGSPLCSGVEGMQSSNHCWRNHAACELF